MTAIYLLGTIQFFPWVSSSWDSMLLAAT